VVVDLVAIEADEVEDMATTKINGMSSSVITRISVDMISVVAMISAAISSVGTIRAVEAMVAAILEATVSIMAMDHAQSVKYAARRSTLLSIVGRGFRRITVALKK
jgi:hypothetical protein